MLLNLEMASNKFYTFINFRKQWIDVIANHVQLPIHIIDERKNKYPYSVKDILEDEEKVEQKRLELEEILNEYKRLIKMYNAKIEEMLR